MNKDLKSKIVTLGLCLIVIAASGMFRHASGHTGGQKAALPPTERYLAERGN